MDLGGLLGGAEEHGVIGLEHAPHLEPRGRHGLAVHREPVRVGLAIGPDLDDASVREPDRRVSRQLDPFRVGGLPSTRRDSRRQVDLEQVRPELIARDDEHQQGTSSAPVHSSEVRERASVPLDVDARAVGHIEDVKRHDGVVGPRRWVAHRARHSGRVRRVGDVPYPHRSFVDPRGGELRSVG